MVQDEVVKKQRRSTASHRKVFALSEQHIYIAAEIASCAFFSAFFIICSVRCPSPLVCAIFFTLLALNFSRLLAFSAKMIGTFRRGQSGYDRMPIARCCEVFLLLVAAKLCECVY